MITREQAAEALFNKLVAIDQFITVRRKFIHWSESAPSEQPAVYLHQTDDTYIQLKNIPPKIILGFQIALYVHNPNPEDMGQTLQNEYLDLIDEALKPDDPDFANCTLDGQVSHCWIEGPITKDEGMLGEQTVALIPVKILLNN